jgi:transcription initiation factor TFIIIB Brf1 subunit/transcription initiation factor TFIIB
MGDKKKKMCKWKKDDIEKDFKEYCKLIRKPEYVCMKCGRVASDKKFLCKPAPIED